MCRGLASENCFATISNRIPRKPLLIGQRQQLGWKLQARNSLLIASWAVTRNVPRKLATMRPRRWKTCIPSQSQYLFPVSVPCQLLEAMNVSLRCLGRSSIQTQLFSSWKQLSFWESCVAVRHRSLSLFSSFSRALCSPR